MKPATPLPWERDYAKHPCIFKRGGDTMRPLAQVKGFDDEKKIQDAEYIVHAANAYPRLVEALRAEVEIDQRSPRDPKDVEAVRLRTIALLRELGEAK